MAYKNKYRYGPPALKNNVDMQLQSAFSDGNWSTVVRLAAKRFATFKDPYYEAIKVSAEAQQQGAAEKCAVLVHVDELVKSKKTPDIDTLDLYEWACQDFIGYEIDFAETFGPLRARWVKANASSPMAASCLQGCLEQWDLVSAQQIAATLDKTNANSADRRYMFWNITLTFLLSVSPQCTEASRKVYSLLTVRQLQKAADITENSDKLEKTDRGLLTEEEVCLYYRVLLSHGTKEEFLTRLRSPKLGAISQLRQGHKLLFCECLDALETWGEWDTIYELCRDALKLGLDGSTTPFFVCDLRIWKKALDEVQDVLKQFIELKDKATPMYKKNISLALLETTFGLPSTTINPNHENKALSPKVIQIGLFLDQYYERFAAFDDVKGYVAELGYEEAKTFLEDVLPKIPGENPTKAQQIIITALESRLRYTLTTCPQTLSPHPTVVEGTDQGKPFQCRVCTKFAKSPCEDCLKKLIVDAAEAYSQIATDKELLATIPKLDRDPRLDLALVMGNSLLKLSGLRPGLSNFAQSLWQDVQPDVLLQAVLLLDTQLKVTPNDNGLRLLLVQLYLLFGCASYAYQLWVPLEVKRTIQDALSPLFFDRISSISPGLFQGTKPLMEPLRAYYSQSLRDPSPVRIWDAFSSGSYTSILDMAEYDKKLRTSCTLVMTLVEERRATRYFGGKLDVDIDDHILAADIVEDTTLVHKTDYGSFPNLESSNGPPIQEFIRLGPGPSQYLDLLTYTPPKDYKPSKPADAAARDKAYTLESLTRINTSLTDFLHKPTTPTLLTTSETNYYTALSLLSALTLTAISLPKSEPSVPNIVSQTTQSLKTTLTTLRAGLMSPKSPVAVSTQQAISSLCDMPAFASVRDIAMAAKLSAGFVLSYHEKETARDKSGKSGLHKEVVAEMKALESAATKTLADAKAHVGVLKGVMNESGWLDRLLNVVLGEEDKEQDEVTEKVSQVVEGRGGAEEWAGKVVDSWREGVKGWGMVRFE
ncbi:N-acetyltransferase B complex non catalytic subunit-domain-containing protein [Apiosordaria backusii]|uniref:N-acetyltransferase B complex non catalytic subunit-domain-containing protein n=1 Tax=Apiosordaria backusii TaxID=314023 RepID=A0AA40DWY0_9PEZI|nr:N-acetyltransferase B complex non catalytic subunit-domain-containing protein [Apiosordaria backusii]